jgi:lysozyme
VARPAASLHSPGSVRLPLAPGLCLLAAACACAEASSPAPQPCLASQRQAVTQVCPGGSVVSGLDVSSYTGPVDWPRVRAAGHAFAFARVSDGTAHLDSRFAGHWRGLRQAGLVRGAYQFFRPAQDPKAQAALLLERLAAAGGLAPGDLPPVLDLEVTDGLSDAAVRAAAQAWLDAVEAATGRPPLLYTAAFMAPVLGGGFGRYPLWVANFDAPCPALPDAWVAWRFWQHTSAGSSPGVAGEVDLDVFDGAREELQAWAGEGSAGPRQGGGVVSTDAVGPRDVGSDPLDAGEDEGSALGSGRPPGVARCP